MPVVAPDGLPGRLLLVGTGDGSPRDLRRAGAALGRAVRGRDRLVTSVGAGAGPDGVRAFVEGLLLGPYAPPSAGLKNRKDTLPVGAAELVGDHPATAVEQGATHAGATIRARDLAETPSNLKSPRWMAQQAAAVAADAGLQITIWDAERLAAEGFGGLLAVGGGSATPPALVRLDHRPPGSRGRRPVRAGRQGHHLRHRRPVDQAARGHGADEDRHVRGGGRARRPRRRARRSACGAR